MNNQKRQPFMNPYVAGMMLGGVLLLSFITLGAGLGASGGISRFAAAGQCLLFKNHVMQSEYFGKWGSQPLNYYLVYMFLGTLFGGFISAFLSNRISFGVERGGKASLRLRVTLALVGGIIAGFASRLAQGCTSGQALNGSALLLTGSMVFMICIFASGYAFAYFFRRQWND